MQMTYWYFSWQLDEINNGIAKIVNKRVQNTVLGYNLKNDWKVSVHFQGKPLSIRVIQVYATTINAEVAAVEWFPEDLQDLLELTHKKDILFITGDWNAKVGNQEIPGETGKFGLGVQNEAGQRLTECYQENTPVIARTVFQQHERRLYTWASPDGQYLNKTDYILCSQRWRSCTLYSQQKEDREMTVAQIMNSLWSNSDWNWRK